MNSKRMRIALILPVLMISTAAAGDWPQILGPTRNGATLNEPRLERWPAPGPRKLWEHKVGSGFAGPVVSQLKCFVFHRIGDDDVLECLDALSGKPVWKQSTPTKYVDSLGFDAGPRCPPLVDGTDVFTLSALGVLSSWKVSTGEKNWAKDLLNIYGAEQGYFGVGASPLLAGSIIMVNIGGKREKAGIVGLDRQTGREIWKSTHHEASYAAPVLATLAGRATACFFTREGLVGLVPETGKELFGFRWRARSSASVNAASPLIVADQVFVTASYQTGARLVRIKPDAFEVIWENDTALSCHYNTPVTSQGHLFGIDGRQEEKPRLRCIEWQSGKVSWSQERFGCAALIVVNDRILALTETGELVLFDADPKEYRERARYQLFSNSEVRALPALSNGRFYAKGKNTLVCVSLMN